MARIWQWLEVGFACLAVALGIAVCVYIFRERSEGAAAWAQAVGTVGAIFFTVRLATREDRRRSEDALAVARLTAAGMTFRLTTALRAVKDALDWAEAAKKFDCSPEDFARWRLTLSELQVCSQEEQLAIIPLPNGCAYKLAGARDRIHVAENLLAELSQSKLRHDSDVRKPRAGLISMVLNEAYLLLEKASSECQLASHGLTSPYA